MFLNEPKLGSLLLLFLYSYSLLLLLRLEPQYMWQTGKREYVLLGSLTTYESQNRQFSRDSTQNLVFHVYYVQSSWLTRTYAVEPSWPTLSDPELHNTVVVNSAQISAS